MSRDFPELSLVLGEDLQSLAERNGGLIDLQDMAPRDMEMRIVATPVLPRLTVDDGHVIALPLAGLVAIHSDAAHVTWLEVTTPEMPVDAAQIRETFIAIQAAVLGAGFAPRDVPVKDIDKWFAEIAEPASPDRAKAVVGIWERPTGDSIGLIVKRFARAKGVLAGLRVRTDKFILELDWEDSALISRYGDIRDYVRRLDPTNTQREIDLPAYLARLRELDLVPVGTH